MRTSLTRALRALADCLGSSTSNLTPNRSAAAAVKCIPPSNVCNTRSNRKNHAGSIFEPLEERKLMSTYYVSASGNDANSGLSTGSAWKSIGKVNSVGFRSGDSVLFQGGQTFSGGLNLTSRDTGVTFSSYNGRATINSGKGIGAHVNSVAGVGFDNLKFQGSPGSAPQSGIMFDGYTGSYLSGDRVNNCEITGYRTAGILIETSRSNAGYTGLKITNNNIHDNVDTGVQTAGASYTGITGLYIAHNQIYNNYGDGYSVCTGSGVMLGDVSNTVVEFNQAFNNGYKGGNGGVGIWAYSSDHVTFQYNESYNNRTTRGMDGDGFDFDLNVSNSVIQYNYAYGNDGTGAQLDQWQNNNLFFNNTVRYNVFVNNGRRNNYGNLEVWGKVLNSYLYNNVIYGGPATSGTNSAIRVHNSTIPGLYVNGVHFVDNIIDTVGGANLINITAGMAKGAKNLTFTGNLYWTNGYNPTFINGTSVLHSLSSWQSAGQESWAGKKTGVFADPKFKGASLASTAAAIAGASSLASAASGYQLQGGSPALTQGLSITSMYGLATGGRDFFGNAIASNATTAAGADQSSRAISAGTSGVIVDPVTPTNPITPTNPVTTTVPVTNVASLAGYDIGNVVNKGSNSSSNGTFTVTAGGADIWGTSDAFRFDEKTLNGNGTIIAKVASLGNSDPWAKAGVMIRSSLAANSAEVSMLISPDHSTSLETRATTGASTSAKTIANASATWVKLVRNGSTFTGYTSADGLNWSLVSTSTVSMSGPVYIGLAVTAHSTKSKETAVFSNVSIA